MIARLEWATRPRFRSGIGIAFDGLHAWVPLAVASEGSAVEGPVFEGRLHEGTDAEGELLEGPTFEGRLDE